jgi:hypothetical protein
LIAPRHGIAVAGTPSGASSRVISIGEDHIDSPSSAAVTTGAQPNPSWKIRIPSRDVGWFTRISSTPSGDPSRSRNRRRETKSIGSPFGR